MPLVLILAGVAVVAVGVAVAILFLRQPDPARRARGLARVAAAAMAVYVIFFGVFVAGETLTDAGSVPAPWLILAWLAPLVLLAALAWFRPDWATLVLATLTVVLVLAAVWFAADPGAWRMIENSVGPIRALASFVLGAALAALGLRRAAPAGWMLLAVGILPVAVSSLGSLDASASLAAVSFMPVICGLVFLAADRLDRQAARAASPADRVRQTRTS
ncbi:hypothetical protein [Cryobacterium tagatosivorans]|uniref:Uncharacterized protein n=1 Tax=Cryobacterium tagatosivorans TaxID=1259199 RepID=A0A4R8UAP6_9MICO|nr:hypothetical protein [Cryobacterium tagatosivorans]TFB47287.1 hypothetical protein E3O23_15645 [Cryobacterium tagatosivorans]